jgi:hypothetical protein
MATISEVATLPAELKSTLALGHDIDKKDGYNEKNDVESVGAGQVYDSSNDDAGSPR